MFNDLFIINTTILNFKAILHFLALYTQSIIIIIIPVFKLSTFYIMYIGVRILCMFMCNMCVHCLITSTDIYYITRAWKLKVNIPYMVLV